jgi:50S ribosomal protein uL3
VREIPLDPAAPQPLPAAPVAPGAVASAVASGASTSGTGTPDTGVSAGASGTSMPDAGASPAVASNEVGVEIFKEGEIVDVRAKTKGRGFAGGMKRHGWHGGPATHGHTSHRRIGSNGANTDPGRVVKGHRMPGHYGNAWRTVKNVKVVRIDKEKNLLFIHGAVPGCKGTIVNVKKT